MEADIQRIFHSKGRADVPRIRGERGTFDLFFSGEDSLLWGNPLLWGTDTGVAASTAQLNLLK